MISVLPKRGCRRTSPFLQVGSLLLGAVALACLFLACTSSQPRVLEARIWRVLEADHSGKAQENSLLVELRIEDEDSFKSIKEIALLNEQRSLYWVANAGQFELVQIRKQFWIVLRDLRLPDFENPPIGKFSLLLESFDGEMASYPLELPSAALKKIEELPSINQGRLSELTGLQENQAYRELVIRDQSGQELRRFLQKGPVETQELRKIMAGQPAVLYIQEFHPREGYIILSGPWEP